MIFGVDVTNQGAWTVVRARGELDLANAPRLRTELLSVLGPGNPNPNLAIDLSLVDLIDSTGLGVLIGALRRARQSGARLVLCGLTPPVQATFSLTGLDTVFELASSSAHLAGVQEAR